MPSARTTALVSGCFQKPSRRFTTTDISRASVNLPPKALIVELHHVAIPDALTDAAKVATCLVVFTGRFTASEVKDGWAPSGGPGRIAIVVVRQSDLVLVATVVLGRIPPRLVFAHVFPRLQ